MVEVVEKTEYKKKTTQKTQNKQTKHKQKQTPIYMVKISLFLFWDVELSEFLPIPEMLCLELDISFTHSS